MTPEILKVLPSKTPLASAQSNKKSDFTELLLQALEPEVYKAVVLSSPQSSPPCEKATSEVCLWLREKNIGSRGADLEIKITPRSEQTRHFASIHALQVNVESHRDAIQPSASLLSDWEKRWRSETTYALGFCRDSAIPGMLRSLRQATGAAETVSVTVNLVLRFTKGRLSGQQIFQDQGCKPH